MIFDKQSQSFIILFFYLSGFHSRLHGSNRNLNQPQHERRKLPALNNSSLSFTTTTTATTTTTSVRTKNYSAFGKLFWKQFCFFCFNNTDRSHGMFNSQRLLKNHFFNICIVLPRDVVTNAFMFNCINVYHVKLQPFISQILNQSNPKKQ